MKDACPDYIQFYPTLRCNRTCRFCFNRGVPGQRDVSVRDAGRLISIMCRLGIGTLDILGGEPTLHPDLEEIISMAVDSGLAVNVSTNGSGSLALLMRIHETDHRGLVRVGVSVNDEEVSGELSSYIVQYRPLLKSVCAADAGMIPKAALPFVGDFHQEFFLIYPDAVGRDDLGQSLPFYEYYENLQVLSRRYRTLQGVYCSGFLPDTDHYPILEHVRCPAGTTKLSILPDGSVYPCYLLFRHAEFRLGNLLTDAFEEIGESPVLEYFRRFEGNTCSRRACPLFSECHGGCPAVSLLVRGDITAPDPRCVSDGIRQDKEPSPSEHTAALLGESIA